MRYINALGRRSHHIKRRGWLFSILKRTLIDNNALFRGRGLKINFTLQRYKL